MKRHTICGLMLALPLLGCSSMETPPEDLPYRLGRTLGLDVILGLTDPERNRDFRIGMVNTALQTGMLLGPGDSSATVQFLRSNESFLWADAAREIARTARTNSQYFDFEFRRTTLTEENCPGLTGSLGNFFTELEKTRSTLLATSTGVPDLSGKLEEIVIDGTSFVIQFMVNDTKFAITPDNGTASTLNSAAANLHRAAGSCTNSVPGNVEHFFY